MLKFLLVILLYEAIHIVELKRRQIDFLKSRLDYYLIDYIDITDYFNLDDWKKTIQHELDKVILKIKFLQYFIRY